MKNQSHIAIYLRFLESLASLDSLPCGGQFYEDSWLIDPFCLIKFNQSFGAIYRLSFIERELGVNFGWNIAWNNFEDIAAEGHSNMIENQVNKVRLFSFIQLIPNHRRILFLLLALAQVLVEVVDSELHWFGDHGLEARFFGSKKNESWIGCWILRLKFFNEVVFPSVSHNKAIFL